MSKKQTSLSVSMRLCNSCNENENDNGKIDHINQRQIYKTQRVSVRQYLDVISTIYVTFQAQFNKKLSKTVAEMKKPVLIKYTCIGFSVKISTISWTLLWSYRMFSGGGIPPPQQNHVLTTLGKCTLPRYYNTVTKIHCIIFFLPVTSLVLLILASVCSLLGIT